MTTYVTPAPARVGQQVRLLCNHLTAENVVLRAGSVGIVVVWRGTRMILFNGGDLLPLTGTSFEVVK